MPADRIELSERDLHDHLRGARMAQRRITVAEIEQTLNRGWEASNAKAGTIGKVLVFEYGQVWEGSTYPRRKSPSTSSPRQRASSF